MWTGGGSGKKKKNQTEWTMGREHGFSAHLMKLDGEKLSMKLLLTQETPAWAGTGVDKLGLPGMHQEG